MTSEELIFALARNPDTTDEWGIGITYVYDDEATHEEMVAAFVSLFNEIKDSNSLTETFAEACGIYFEMRSHGMSTFLEN